MFRTTKLHSAVIAGMAMLLLAPAASAAAAGHAGGGNAQTGAYLGVHISDLTPEQAAGLNGKSGVFVQSLDQDGPACKAGLKAGDIIIAVGGKQVQGTQQVAEMMQNMSPGKAAIITVVRDGATQDIKVTLGTRHDWTSTQRIPVANAFSARAAAPPLPPTSYSPDFEVPVFTPAAALRGMVVESLTPQLAEYFAVPAGQGVLVRNVQKGSLAANTGFKAGDVIVKINGEVIRDLADWRRGMRSSSGKTSFSIIREKREQTLQMNVPVPTGDLRLGEDDWDQLDMNMDALNQQMERLGPELQRQTEQAMMLRQDDLEKMQRDIEKSIQGDGATA